MANGKDRDITDNDIDRRPGGAAESREYARKYDPRVEREFSNRLETPNLIELARLEAENREAASEALFEAQSHVHFFPTVGKFIIPQQNTWAAHAQLAKDDRSGINFNPNKYVYFDKIIAERLENPALYDRNHPDYARYEGLRTNLEVLRNDIIGIYMEDGSFDPGDEKYIPQIAGIATALGDALAGDNWFRRPFTRTISMDVANVEGIGAREMYKFLLEMQIPPAGRFQTLRRNLKQAFGIPARAWELPPLEETPFSPEGLAAPPIPPENCLTDQELLNACAHPDMQQRVASMGSGAVSSARRLNAVDTLTMPQREASIDEARTILRWLRNLKFTDRDTEEWLAQGTPPERIAKAESVARLIEIFDGQLALGVGRDPQLRADPAIREAGEAAGAMALALTRMSMDLLPQDHPHKPFLVQSAESLPPEAALREAQSVERLLNHLEHGIDRASGKTVSPLSAGERLADIGKRVSKTAYSVRSVDTLEPPTREESIELAREILRKMKLLAGNKTLDELNTGRPEEKLAAAEKIEEMVDAYKTLLAEAVEINPAILSDPRIKEANDAMGGFAHAVKLMAAKEIPVSISAAQQISADITQMPEEWKKLHDRTVDRLITSMEGGLEKAVGDIQAEQEQGQDEDLAQENISAQLTHADQSKRKRRRRKRTSGTTAGKMRKINRDITADDYALKQGRFAERPRVSETPPGKLPDFRPEDLAAIKEAGGSLRDIGNQVASLPLTHVPLDDKVVPDDKAFTLREREQQEKPGQRPRI